jgi:hypothetical protein
MKTVNDVKARVEQIKGIPQHSGRFSSPAHKEIRESVVAYVEGKLAAEVVDAPALWEVMNDAMSAHIQTPALAWSPPKSVGRVEVASDPAPAVSPRTGKPKRKYTRRKKA